MVMGIAADANADEFKLTPLLAVEEEYNDNILYSPSDAQKDFITTLSPGIALTDRTERMDLALSGRIDQRLYSSNGGLNATDQYYEGNGKYTFTQRLNLSGKALYSQDSRLDRDFETTGLPLTNVKRKRQNYTFSGDYLLSEKTMTAFSYDYLNDTYDSLSYTDLEAHTFNLGLVHDLRYFWESTRARMNVGYAKYNIPDMKMNNYEATIGIEHAFHEKWSLLFDGGGRYTKSQFKVMEYEFVPILPPFIYEIKPVERVEKSSGWGVVGQLTLTYKGERDSGSISAVHDIQPASGRSGSTERTSFVFDVSRRFTYELYGTLWAGYYINKSTAGKFSTQNIDENTIGVTPGIRYEFDKDKSLEASYTYNRTKYNVSGVEASRNIFQVRLRMQHHLFE
jgi:hypothetical protein